MALTHDVADAPKQPAPTPSMKRINITRNGDETAYSAMPLITVKRRPLRMRGYAANSI
ncbi:MAG: hypothetical protein WCF90_00870 [Methanomicrobiales archaeon]